ncbi:MAG: hypothetical protein QOH24_158 [Verrucomicrobiota bacterium]|jgi:hypothetical protein
MEGVWRGSISCGGGYFSNSFAYAAVRRRSLRARLGQNWLANLRVALARSRAYWSVSMQSGFCRAGLLLILGKRNANPVA